MRTVVEIPDTGLKVTPIVLGTTAWRGDMANELLSCFLDLGGQVIDTARLYGYPDIGFSEECIGRWIKTCGRRSELVIISKGGHPPVESMLQSRMTISDMTDDLNASLRALQTDWIDIYFYHRDDKNRTVGELLEQMESFRQAGKIRWYGCSNWTVERMRAADEYAKAHGLRGFIGNQAMYNMGTPCANPNPDRTMLAADKEMLAYHRESRNILMPYSALCNGFFHGLLKNDGRDLPSWVTAMFATKGNMLVLQRIRQLMSTYDASVTQVLVAYLLTHELPMLPLIGCCSMKHIIDMMSTLNMPFTHKDFI